MTEKSKGGLLGLIGKPGVNKDMLLSKMAKIPKGYTHIGIANTEVGVTAVVASEDWHNPMVYDPISKEWVGLIERSKGGFLQKAKGHK